MFSSVIKRIPYRAFSAVTLSPAEQLFDKIYNGVQVMKSLNDPFVVEKTANQLSINKQSDKEFTITLLHNGNLRFLSPENHYNDYHYVSEDDAFENVEDGHNILESFTRDILLNYNGCPDLYCVWKKQ